MVAVDCTTARKSCGPPEPTFRQTGMSCTESVVSAPNARFRTPADAVTLSGRDVLASPPSCTDTSTERVGRHEGTMTSSRMMSPAVTRPATPEKRTTLWAAIALKFVPLSMTTSPAFTAAEESAPRVGGSTAHASKSADFSGRSRIEVRMTYLPSSLPSRSRTLANPVESLVLVGGVNWAPTGPKTISQSTRIPSAGRSPSSVRTATVKSRSRTARVGRTDHPLLPL